MKGLRQIRLDAPLAWSAVLLAWSLSTSLFGMQVAVILGSSLLLGILALRLTWPGTALDRPFVAWLLAIALSLILAPSPPASLLTATSWWVLSAFFVAHFGLTTPRLLRWALAGFVGAAVLVSVLALVQSLSGLDPFSAVLHPQVKQAIGPAPGVPGFFGAVGLFFSRLTLAHVLIFPIAWVSAWLLRPLGWRWRLGHFLLLIMLLAGLASTWTRAAPLVLALAIGGLILARLPGGRLRWGVLAGGLVLLILAGAILGPHLPDRLRHSFAGKHDWGRLTIWHAAQDLSSLRPLTGIGYGNFQRDSGPIVESRRQQVGNRRFPGTIAWAHNLVLSVMAECGFLGLLAFVWIFFAYFRAARRRLRSMPDDEPWLRGFVHGSMAGVGAFLLVGLFHDPFWDGEVVFALLFTMGASLSSAVAKEEDRAEGSWGGDLLPVMGLALAAMALVVGASQAILAYRSTASMLPGRLDFLPVMAIVAALTLSTYFVLGKSPWKDSAVRPWLALVLGSLGGSLGQWLWFPG
ncbi:MAG: hypothetical protein JRF33_13220 [Deltaproteobacteria bacterium]|nr:hypothetical protein [Deltaproteobacteria bacterium]